MAGTLALKEEFNATGRANKGKIQDRSKYVEKGTGLPLSPGKLTLSVKYENGCLKVFLKSAHDLFGKRSQDPYALCYLLDESAGGVRPMAHANTWFEEGNMKTATKDKTLDPVWDHAFTFRVAVGELVRKSLVVAIWDDDSTSRDDYMAGVRLSMQEVQFFDASLGLVTLELQPQLADGHPGELDQATWRRIFGYVVRGWDLKTCNNHLVTLIEKARVLTEAQEVKHAYSRVQLTEKTSVTATSTSTNMFHEEMARMRELMAKRKLLLEERRRERDRLRAENTGLVRTFQHHQEELRALCSRCCGLTFDVGRYFEHTAVKVKEVGIHWEAISMGQHSRLREFIERIIRIRTFYEETMRKRLTEVRHQYSVNYEQFIGSLQRDMDKIMALYKDIIDMRAAKNPDYRNGLLSLESKRNYSVREQSLVSDIHGLEANIQALLARKNHLGGLWMPQIHAVDAELAALMSQLRELLQLMRQYAEARYTETNEVAIYDKLLSLEEQRVRESHMSERKTVSVRSNTQRMSQSVTTGAGHYAAAGTMSSPGMVMEQSGHIRRESGYSTRESVHSMYSESTATRRSQRSSAGSTLERDRHGERDSFLDNLQQAM